MGTMLLTKAERTEAVPLPSFHISPATFFFLLLQLLLFPLASDREWA